EDDIKLVDEEEEDWTFCRLVRAGRRGGAAFDFLQDENQWDAQEAGKAEEAEVLDEGPQGGLSEQGIVDEALGLHLRQLRSAFRGQGLGYCGQAFDVNRVVRSQMPDH